MTISIGTVLITEWINVEYYGISDFDPPVLRFGKAFTTLGVALGIVGTFQVSKNEVLWCPAVNNISLKLFILRNPAKRDLRKRIGKLLFAQLSYLTLLQAFVRGGELKWTLFLRTTNSMSYSATSRSQS